MNSLRKLAFVAVMGTALALSACSSKKKAPDDSIPNAIGANENLYGDSDSGTASGLQSVNFPYDSYLLTSETKNAIKANAAVLKDNPSMNVQIEGHCDQRGGIQYNIALGDKRAKAVMRYLVDLGVSGSRVTTISYGKERPVDPSMNESAYSRNRRANFVITQR